MRFRLYPTATQAVLLAEHCAHARFVWNLGLEQRNCYRPALGPTPGWLAQCRQLTEARAASEWLGSGSRIVQQQALRDLDRAFTNWWSNPGHFGRPTWRKRGAHEGFQVVGSHAKRWERLSRKHARIVIPKVGWVRWQWSRHPGMPKSYRVTKDPAGRWWIAFAIKPEPIAGPGDGSIIGVDRGVTVPFALSTGELIDIPGHTAVEKRRLLRLQRQLARQVKGSNRREATKVRLARLKAREVNRRKDVVEKLTTRLAKEHDLLRVENLIIPSMTRSAKGTVEKPGVNVRQKAGLNRGILRSGWGLFARRLEDKAPGRVERVAPEYTSQRCAVCEHTAAESRESQAVFRCRSCGHEANADVNAARNIAAGHAVTACGGKVLSGPAVET